VIYEHFVLWKLHDSKVQCHCGDLRALCPMEATQFKSAASLWWFTSNLSYGSYTIQRCNEPKGSWHGLGSKVVDRHLKQKKVQHELREFLSILLYRIFLAHMRHFLELHYFLLLYPRCHNFWLFINNFAATELYTVFMRPALVLW
jgi:hypothetical protein